MLEKVKIYAENSKEYKRLSDFCDYMNNHTSLRYEFFVKDTYYDLGADWKYTAVCVEDDKSKAAWQVLNANEYEQLLREDSDYKERVFERIWRMVIESRRALYASSDVDLVLGGTRMKDAPLMSVIQSKFDWLREFDSNIYHKMLSDLTDVLGERGLL